MPCLRVGAMAFAILVPSVLHAQTNCAERDSVVQSLASSYGENFAGGGVQNAQRIFEVWHSEEKGTWTILMTRADGKSCIMASGTNWREGDGVKVPQGIPG